MSYQNNAAAVNGLFNSYYVFNKIPFDYLKACNQVSPKLEMEQALMLLTSDIPSYYLSGLNVRFPEKPLYRRILDKEMSQICGELKQTFSYMLNNQDPEFYKD